MHVSMCLLVRNEEAIIEDNLAFHFRMGVDRFLIMNHLSTDGTVQAIERAKATLHLDVSLYHQTDSRYLQAEWMTFLAREAHRLGTDWIVLCDADEFWLPNGGSLKLVLEGAPPEFDVVRARWHNSTPLKGTTPYYNNILFAPHPFLPKIAVRSRDDITIRMGNHEAAHIHKWYSEAGLRVMHYQNRPDDSLKNKYIIGGEALGKSSLPEEYGIHWRQGLERHQKGEFEAFADGLFYDNLEDALKVPEVYSDETVRKVVLRYRKIARKIEQSRSVVNWLEITSIVGCGNRCSYCPQDVFMAAYGKIYPDGERAMTLETFERILDHVNPDLTAIHFSGFSEIFLHPLGHKFIARASERGFDIALFTTLVGFTPQKAALLSRAGVEFEWVRLHEYDGHSFNKSNFEQGSRLLQNNFLIEKFETIKIARPISRGGNLWEPGYYPGPVWCDRFHCNVVMPNGMLHLCCSDWGLKHPIGDLLARHYDSPELDKSRTLLQQVAATKDTDTLCKHCELGRAVF